MDQWGPRGTQQLASLITFFLKNLNIIMNKQLEGAQRVHIRQVDYSFIATSAALINYRLVS